MSSEQKCKKCGAVLATFDTSALCPTCMLSEAIGLGVDLTHQPATARPGPGAIAGATFATERPGDRIDHYRLLQAIGEGGMGIVYLAEQESPLRRRVALKIIKLGMDTKAVIARFEAEQQALALMDHPSIAKVLDAGTTLTGRPYFVMEFVRGLRITDYCDQNRRSLRQRLDLFMQICQAIQHAHQKGIIHRDIKPSNILITQHNGVPVPKIIDFGIAKATNHQRLTDGALLTTFEQFMGTPAYMSPEQAEMSRLDLDTRSDIYSLGVLLYELLTGRTPFDANELSKLGLDEMRRKIREDEPRKPSLRLSAMNPADAVAVTKHFKLPPTKLAALVRGDLDWIVMKCLEKDPSRRYHTANGLAMDIQRYLGDEPVLARPPSAAYRFKKQVRRNRITFVAVSAVAAALIFGFVVSTYMFLKERTAAEQSQTVARLLKGMLQDLNPAIAPGSHAKILHGILDKTVERVATDLTAQPEIEAEMCTLIGNAYYELDDFPASEKMYRKALRVREAIFGERNSLVAASLDDLGNALEKQDQRPEGEKLKRNALAIRQSLFGDENAEVAKSLTSLAESLTYQKPESSTYQTTESLAYLKRLKDAEALQLKALAMQRKFLDERHPDIFVSLNSLARLLRDAGKEMRSMANNAESEALAAARDDQNLAVSRSLKQSAKELDEEGRQYLSKAEKAYREALATAKDDQNLAVSRSLTQLAKVLVDEAKFDEAEIAARKALELRRTLLDHDHKMVNGSFHFLVNLLQKRGEFEEVETLFRERLHMMQSQLPPEEPEITHTLVRFTEVLIAAKEFAKAESFARESLGLREKQTPGDWRIYISRSLLGACLLGQKKYAEAEPWLISGYEGLKQREAKMPAFGRPYLLEALQRLVEFYIANDRPDQAAKWRQQLEELAPPAPETKSAAKTTQ